MSKENDHNCECSVCAERYAQLRCSAATVDPEKAEVAERFRLFGEKGFRPEVFGIDDRVPGPMVTQRDCMLIAAALSTVEPQEVQDWRPIETARPIPGVAPKVKVT